MFYVGFCPVCEEGTLGVRICGGCTEAVILCDECDAVWLYADCAGDAIYPSQPALPCPRCGASLYDEPSHWASWQEVDRCGWAASVLGEGAALDDDAQIGTADGKDLPGPNDEPTV